MAAASAGSLQSGSPITGMMPTSTSSNVVDNQLPPVIQAPSTVYHQQSLQPQNPNLQFHQQQGGLPQPHPFLPRAGNGSQLSGSIARHCGANEESLIGSGPSGMITGPQQLQHSNAAAMIQQRQSHIMHAANLAPGWRRLISNNEVIYISPSGASLRTHGQIKDYLLSPSTCKCGLPCPLRPEHFFDFNSQVPNSSLHIAVENGLTSRMHCQHQKRFIENNHNLQQKDFKRRKFNDATTSKKLITSPVPQCNSVAVYSGNVMQTSHSGGNSGRMHIVPSQRPNQQLVTNTSTQHSINTKQQAQMQENLLIKVENEKQIGNVTLSKTPPWRKNYALQQQHGNQQSSQQNHISASTSIIGQAYLNNNNNERVPPLPQSHFCPTPLTGQNLTPPWHNEQPQNRFLKARSSPVAVKKKPNFKDDPTGYMDHQTAILHSSILNIVQTPEEPVIEDNYKSEQMAGGTTIRTPAQKPILQQIKIEAGTSLMPQNQNIYPHNSISDGKNPHIKTEPSQMDVKTFVQTSGRVCVGQFGGYHHSEQQQMAPQPANFAHSQQPRMITPSQVIETSLKNHQIQTGTQQVIANVPSSQQIIEKSGPVIRTQYQSDEHINQIQQATTTTIGGQTVTHFPNGMVQVEQNCDSIATLKPQQQIQLQQQIQQHNMLYRQNQQIQKSIGKVATDFSYNDQKSLPVCIVPVSQDSPVSSSTTLNRITPERRIIPDNKGPPQVGAISTSNQSPHPCPSPADSPESSSTSMKPPTPHSVSSSQIRPQQGIFATSQTSGRNTITSVTAGKTITATTSVSDRSALHAANTNNIQPQQRLNQNNIIPVSNIQLQSVVRESPNQIIMTSTGQLIVVPSQSNKSSNQVIINSPTGSNLVVNNQQNVLINQQSPQLIGNSVDVLNNQSNSANIIQGPGNGLVIQNSGIVQPGQNILQSPNNLITNNNSNFIVNSSSTMQSMILNNSNLLQQSGQSLITANGTNIMQTSGGSNIVAAGNSSKVISNNGNILNNQSIITNQPNVINNQVLSNTSNGGLLGQQTVVLNTLPNGYVIQPNFVDGQVVSQIMNQENGSSYLQQQQQQPRHIILTSPDSKRKAKKRKSSASSSPSTPSSLSPQQSPTIQQQVTPQSQNQAQSAVVQIAPQYPAQGFQISSGIQGIVVNKNTQPTGPQQQILFQNGQIIQPVNLIGQQLLVPAGLVVAPETTLVQIQNVGSCGSIITPQGMVLRAPSPQNKNFLSPNASGQQFIVSGNSQMSPLGQLYGTPVGLMVPQSSAGTATFVQQSTAIVQQTAMVNNSNNNSNSSNSSSSNNNSSGNCNNSNNGADNCNEQSSQNQGIASPPDTTTHSPRSPERPPSEKSGGSDMVQCVSSSEPDSVVSPVVADSAQSPSTTEYERSGSISYQTNNAYKPSDAKIRKMEASLQFGSSTQEISSQMKPDSHESPTNSPPASATSAISSSGSTGPRSLSSGCSGQLPSFSIGELVWGPARGHPAWPGKVINPPDGICTPSDSTWVQWFGGRPNIELIAINSLKSLSEGLEAHHKAQKDTRKSRKLNSQLERAIQEAMTELDRMSSVVQPSTAASTALSTSKNRGRGRQPSNLGQARTKPVKIAPAPPCANTIQQIRPQQQTVAQVAHHQQPSQPQQTSPTQSK